GADYILTQPMYDEEKIAELGEATKQIEVPIFVGIMPLTSSKNAEFLHNEVPGIKLSDHVRERMQAAQGDRENSPTKAMPSCTKQMQGGERSKGKSNTESIAISKELIDEALEHFNGIYLITPFMRYDIVVELVHYIHEKTGVEPVVTENANG